MNFTDMMKQAAGLQQKMEEMQEKIAGLEAEGSAGAGLVKVTLNGKGYASRVTIDPSLMVEGEREVLEDLMTAAINDAKSKLEVQSQEQMKSLTQGIPMPPGMKLPF
ncbi:YbaB/EbfC family nucleoid-associated protein [Parvularcula sp. LCG005]|uniref:YbaB/EbfC family nucleoid-associated protein n=1 Tax=Parvularcula sp. LCG005 TaxID=3078805 RepID=UPI0029429566|nr:YbaB/EbfC family nucleoid-associated protein [Parvularcula sp. LCG005]WOI53153.1 YbaB/EbfC family nucleoid-associated protein [Parvularcula sp. LCG005]